MADETVTTPENNTPVLNEEVHQPDNRTTAAGQETAPESTAEANNHSAHPSPAALAKKATHIPVTAVTSSYSQDLIQAAVAFGRVDEQGTVYVTDGDNEREVGQFPDAANADEALNLYARRYLDLKEKLDLFAARLQSANIKSKEIDKSLKTLEIETQEPAVVGDIPALRSQLGHIKEQAETKKEQLAQERMVQLAQAVQERTSIVEEAETIVASLSEQTNWRQTADKLKALFEQWQEHQRTSIRIDKKNADALWKRFSTARSAFNQSRRKWAQERDASREQAKKTKEEIISRANEIKDSVDWAATSHEFNQLMDRWKAAGRAGRNEDDTLWAQFRQAADTFFNARQADRDKTSTDEQENLKLKEALVVKAEALLPVDNEQAAKQARQALAKIQEEWDQIGYVPRNDMRRIESRLDAVDRQIKAVEDAGWKKSDPEAEARKSNFERQLESQLAELDQQIAKESDTAKKQQLEAEKAAKEQWLKAIQ